MRAKVIVVPVYQKHWLYHVWSEATAAEAASERNIPWTQGASLQDKAALLGKELGHRVHVVAHRQWQSLQAAEEGTFKNRLYRLAQWVLSQEDPTETFLKALPRSAQQLEVIHPTTLSERLVRRRLRRLALAQEQYHHRRILGWTLATLPQLPLVITPFPNVTLYYTAYKLMSHYQALQGCRTLRSAFQQWDVLERQRVATAAAAAAAAAAAPERGSGGGGGGLLRLLPIPRLRRAKDAGGDRCDNKHTSRGESACSAASPEVAGRGAGASVSSGPQSPSSSSPQSGTTPGSSKGGGDSSSSSSSAPPVPAPEFLASAELDLAVRPLERWQSPLTDEMAVRVRELFRPQHHHHRHGPAQVQVHAASSSSATARQQKQQQLKEWPGNHSGNSTRRKAQAATGGTTAAGTGAAEAPAKKDCQTGGGGGGGANGQEQQEEEEEEDGVEGLPGLVARLRTQVLEREKKKKGKSWCGCGEKQQERARRGSSDGKGKQE